MKYIFYKNFSDNRVLNKELHKIKEMENVVRKIDKSIFEPTLEVKKDSALNNCNYVYIENFDRYYFITDIIDIGGNTYRIETKQDVLSSFKDSILNLTALVKRQEFKRNTQIVDNELLSQANNNFYCRQVGNPVNSDYNIYLTTCGGSDENKGV